MRRSLFASLTIALTALTLAACGHMGGGSGHRGHHGGGGMGGPGGSGRGPADAALLKRFDANGDGNITRDEVMRGLHDDFAKFDSDRDGFLNPTEARVVNDERRAQGTTISPVFDWNGDGHIDFTEFANQWLTLFDQFDADHDGVVTDAEINHPVPGGSGEQGGGGHGGGRHRGGGS